MGLSHPANTCLAAPSASPLPPPVLPSALSALPSTGTPIPSVAEVVRLQLPVYPASWYLFCRARELRKKPRTRYVLGRELVAFRTISGRVTVLDARCGHMGADLGRGRVVGEAIRCPYHHWEYAPTGECTHIPAQRDIPAYARQRCYPVVERYGQIFFFNGREPLFPLPFFDDARPEEFVAGRPIQFVGDFPWYMWAANTFDAQHWKLHDRKLLGEPVIDSPHPLARRTVLRAQVAGDNIFDRLTRWFAGDTVELSITNWGGTIMVVTATLQHMRSYGIATCMPVGSGKPLLVHVIVFAERSSNRLARLLSESTRLWIRRLFAKAFVRDEFDELSGIRYDPRTLTASDSMLAEYFAWAAALPREAQEPGIRSQESGVSSQRDEG
jgi:nitrite reductase/ring-hydroxylating ferredoxin subunit